MKNSLVFQTEMEEQQLGANFFSKTNEDILNQATQRLTYKDTLLCESKNTNTSENINKDTLQLPNTLEKNISYISILKQPPLIRIKTNSLQNWEGIVLEIKADYFIARLHDLTSKNPDEEAEFPLEEVSEEDKQLLIPGALFYWNIGYRDNCGQRERISSIRFQRMPAWRRKDLEESKMKAAYIRKKLGW